MNMVGKIRDKNETMDMDQLFSSGYEELVEASEELFRKNAALYMADKLL